MKRIIYIVMSLFLMLSMMMYGGCKEKNPKPEGVPNGYLRFDVDQNNGKKTSGFGAQIDSDNFMPWNKLTPEEETMLATRVDDMNLQNTRLKFFTEFFERGNDNDDFNTFDFNSKDVDFNSVEMQAVYKVLDICEKNNTKVDFSWYGCKSNYHSYDGKYTDSWIAYPQAITMGWVSAPRVFNYSGTQQTTPFPGYEEYAESISVMLDYLINVKKYTCVNEFSIIFESFGTWDGSLRWDEYVKLCRIVDARLKQDGLRDKFMFSFVIDDLSNISYFKERVETIKGLYDVLNIGSYKYDNSYDDVLLSYCFEPYAESAAEFGTTVKIVEAGTCNFSNAVTRTDIDTYDSGMYMAKLAIRAMMSGLTGVNYYILGDTYFNNEYVHRMGLWFYRTEGWKAHPTYYFWSLLTKFSAINADIYPIAFEEKNDIIPIAFQMSDGSWSYMMVNRSNEVKNVAFVNNKSDKPKIMDYYKVSEALIPESREVKPFEACDTIDASSGIACFSVPANGFVVVSNMK